MQTEPNRGGRPPNAKRAPRTTLSPRERDIATLVGKGMRDKEIAGLLSVPTHRVKDDLKTVFRITDSTNRVELAVWACKQGWL